MAVRDTSLDMIFRPRSIAVIGATDTPGKVGRELVHTLVGNRFSGIVFPVNPKHQVIHSIKCFPSVLKIPDEVDLAIIVVPKKHVLKVVDECGRKGVKGIVVITAGFREIGPEGAKQESKLLQKVKKYGMRLVGPNCMGIINANPEYRLFGTFVDAKVQEGNVGYISQSGALGAALLSSAHKINLGFSMFVSVGNKADISSNDLLQYWENDDSVKVILMYVEGFGNPRTFTAIAKSLSRKKPILAVKAGRTAAGARAASSHTGAMAERDVAIDALLNQCGVIRAYSVNNLFDIALAFSYQPLPKGPRIAIVSNAGGPGIMATDVLINHGLTMAELSEKSKRDLASFLPDEASVNNPVDLIASAGPEEYRKSLEVVLKDKGVDGVIAIFVPPIMVNPVEVAEAIQHVSSGYKKPVLSCLMGQEEFADEIRTLGKAKIPVYSFPESCAASFAAMVEYRAWLDRDPGKPESFKVDSRRVNGLLKKVKAQNREHLSTGEAMEVLDAYGIQAARSIHIAGWKQLKSAAASIGFPVVMKADLPALVHKTDAGGVKVDIRTEPELFEAYEEMSEKFAGKYKGRHLPVLVQQLVRGGREMILGVTQDPLFGPLVMCGLGGIHVEILKDVQFRVLPITDTDALEMLDALRGVELLRGYRGEPAVDLEAVANTLLRLGQVVTDYPEIVEIEINPFMATSERATSRAVDARIRISLS